MVTTAALICVLSVFNGFHDLIKEKLSTVDPDIAITATMATATVATGTVDQPGLCGLVLHQPLGRESLTGSVAQAAFYSGPSGPLFSVSPYNVRPSRFTF